MYVQWTFHNELADWVYCCCFLVQTTSRRLADRKSAKFQKNILKRGGVPETTVKKGNTYPVGPILLGFFVFIVIGSCKFSVTVHSFSLVSSSGNESSARTFRFISLKYQQGPLDLFLLNTCLLLGIRDWCSFAIWKLAMSMS